MSFSLMYDLIEIKFKLIIFLKKNFKSGWVGTSTQECPLRHDEFPIPCPIPISLSFLNFSAY